MITADIQFQNIDTFPASVQGHLEHFIEEVFKYVDEDNKELSLLFTDNAGIMELNRTFRGKHEPTDVLSFCQREGIIDYMVGVNSFVIDSGSGIMQENLGDIIISVEFVEKNAEDLAILFDDELHRVIVHGILHLLGREHNSTSTDEPMLIEQEQILTELSVLKG